MKILVTGGAGFIGSHIVDAYIQAGHQVVVIDDLSVGKAENLNPQATFYQVDVTDQAALAEIFEKERPEVVNHHAAQKFLRRSVEFPVEDAMINVIGSLYLLELCRQYGCQQLIFPSTAAVYGDNTDNLPYPETFVGQPIAPYSAAKLSVEHYLHTYSVNYGLKTVALRYANVYGPRQDAHGESGVIAIFAEQLLAGQTPTIFGTGEQTRDYVYIDDVVAANLLFFEKPVTGVFNISTAVETPLNEIYRQVASTIGVAVVPKYAEAKKGDPARLCLDNAKAKSELGWQPKVKLGEGIERTAAWFKS